MKRTLSLLLAAVTLLSLISCADGSQTAADTGASSDETTPASEETTTAEVTEYTPEVEEKDWGGTELTFIVADAAGKRWETKEYYAQELTGELINDTVFERNSNLEGKYNFKITEFRTDDVYGNANRAVTAGSDEYDVIVAHIQNSATLALAGGTYNLKNLPYIDLEKPWWDALTNNSMTIVGKQFFALGDVNFIDNLATWSVLFNKKIAADSSLDNHYEAVDAGKWTMDLMYENAKAVARDLDGDGEMGVDDMWGVIMQDELTVCMFIGAGQMSVTKNAEDLPELTLNSERTVAVLEKLKTYFSDPLVNLNANKYTSNYTDVWAELSMGTFRVDRSLYYNCAIAMIPHMRDMESDFGILPLPKYDTAQEQYYNTFQYNNATAVQIPVTLADPACASYCLEVLAAANKNTLTPAYYDTLLSTRLARDEESSAMLDLIFSTRVIDYGLVFNWGSMQTFLQSNINTESWTFTSKYASIEKSVTKTMEKSVEKMKEMDN